MIQVNNIQTHYTKIRVGHSVNQILEYFVHNAERKSFLRKNELPGKYSYRGYKNLECSEQWKKKIPSMHMNELLEEMEEQLIFVQIGENMSHLVMWFI